MVQLAFLYSNLNHYILQILVGLLKWLWDFSGNLYKVLPGKMVTGKYNNNNGHLPSSPGRLWYEADINYTNGYRKESRIVFSNDGLIFISYNHYETFIEIV